MKKLILAALFLWSAPALAYNMTPATGYADFVTPGDSNIIWSFPEEILWNKMIGPNGETMIHIRLEIMTRQFTDPVTNITYGPGTFVKDTGAPGGGASGLFKLWIGCTGAPPCILTANSPQFWWPGGVNGGAVQQQPPPKLGQGFSGWCQRTEGISNSAMLGDGFTSVVPFPANDSNGVYILFEKTGPGKLNEFLKATDFIASGQVDIRCDVFYMIDQ